MPICVFPKCCVVCARRVVSKRALRTAAISMSMYSRRGCSFVIAAQWRTECCRGGMLLVVCTFARLTQAQGKGSLGNSSRARCCFCSAGVVDFTARSGLARAAATFNSTFDPPSHSQARPRDLTSKPSRHQPQETQTEQILGGGKCSHVPVFIDNRYSSLVTCDLLHFTPVDSNYSAQSLISNQLSQPTTTHSIPSQCLSSCA